MSAAISDCFERYHKLPKYGQAEQSLVSFSKSGGSCTAGTHRPTPMSNAGAERSSCSAALSTKQGIVQQHGDRHRPHATGNWCNGSSIAASGGKIYITD